MKTTHNNIEIEWEFENIEDDGYDNNFAEWNVKGKGLKCNNWCRTCRAFDWSYCEKKYIHCFADATDPESSNTGIVENIEEI